MNFRSLKYVMVQKTQNFAIAVAFFLAVSGSALAAESNDKPLEKLVRDYFSLEHQNDQVEEQVEEQAKALWQAYQQRATAGDLESAIHPLNEVLKKLNSSGANSPQTQYRILTLARVIQHSVMNADRRENPNFIYEAVVSFSLQSFPSDKDRDIASSHLVKSVLENAPIKVQAYSIDDLLAYTETLKIAEFKSNLASLTRALTLYQPERPVGKLRRLKYAVGSAIAGSAIAAAAGVALVGGGEVLVETLSMVFSVSMNAGRGLNMQSVALGSAGAGGTFGLLFSSTLIQLPPDQQFRNYLLQLLSTIDFAAYKEGWSCARMFSNRPIITLGL
jgi:hypothetical protein